jgi:hypothetical protein
MKIDLVRITTKLVLDEGSQKYKEQRVTGVVKYTPRILLNSSRMSRVAKHTLQF